MPGGRPDALVRAADGGTELRYPDDSPAAATA